MPEDPAPTGEGMPTPDFYYWDKGQPLEVVGTGFLAQPRRILTCAHVVDDLEQLRRDCSDALEVLLREQRTDRIAGLAETLRELGPPYRFHGELMHGALRDGQDNAITWHLIQVPEKLEQSTRQGGQG